jgi:hypothetical protein
VTIALVAIAHPRLEARENLAAHLDRVASSLAPGEVIASAVVREPRALRSLVAGRELTLLYVLAHATAAGLHFADGTPLPAPAFAAAVRACTPPGPRAVWLATCDAARAGLVDAARAAGAAIVLAVDGAAPITALCRLVERSLASWLHGGPGAPPPHDGALRFVAHPEDHHR